MSLEVALALATSGVNRIAAAAALSDVNAYQAELQKAIEDLRNAFCRTDLKGQQHPTIRADRQGIGALPIAATALVASVEALWKSLPTGASVVPADAGDVAAINNWLDVARARCASAVQSGPTQPSELVWRGVVLPLLNGWEYADLPLAVQPGFDFGAAKYVQRPPAIARPVTIIRNAAWYGGNVTWFAQTMIAVSEWGENAGAAMSAGFGAVKDWVAENIIDPIKEPAAKAAKGLLVAVGVGVGVAVLWLFGRR